MLHAGCRHNPRCRAKLPQQTTQQAGGGEERDLGALAEQAGERGAHRRAQLRPQHELIGEGAQPGGRGLGVRGPPRAQMVDDGGPLGHRIRGGIGQAREKVFDRAGVKSSGPADAARDAWARGILLADGMRLEALAAELSSWHATPIFCAPEVAELRVVGAFPLKDIDRIFASLESSLPVRLVREGDVRRIVPAPEMPSSAEVTPPRRLE